MIRRESVRTFNILLVEDNPGDVELTRVVLSTCSVANRISVAHDGQQAMAILRRQGTYATAKMPDLVLLDLNLPNKNGTEVLKEMKDDPFLKRIPVVVMTSSKAHDEVDRSYDLHANCFVTKPVELHTFRTVVHSLVTFWCTIATLPANLEKASKAG
jgi:CheY-like chemotaxis protein